MAFSGDIDDALELKEKAILPDGIGVGEVVAGVDDEGSGNSRIRLQFFGKLEGDLQGGIEVDVLLVDELPFAFESELIAEDQYGCEQEENP